MDLISVIVPVYRVENYLRKCIDSIRAQTYRELEIILVDDGSPDQCPDICDKYAQRDERIRVIHKENGGLSSARNAGLAVAEGKYIGFVDSDDYIAPDMYEIMHGTIVREQADLVLCGVIREDEGGKTVENDTINLDRDLSVDEEGFWHIFSNYLHIVDVLAMNKLYTRKLFDTERYDVGRIHEDDFILHRIIRQCGKISCLKQPLYHYVTRPGSIMQSKTLKSYYDALDAFKLREEYLVDSGFTEAAVGVMWHIMLVLLVLRKALDRAESKKILDSYKYYLKDLYRSSEIHMPLRMKLRLELFFINPAFYQLAVDLYEKYMM